jgi:hypothetical protein
MGHTLTNRPDSVKVVEPIDRTREAQPNLTRPR